MKEAEYFQRARDDAGFRRDKIVELKEQKSLTGWMLLCIGGLLTAVWLVASIMERRWLDLGSSLSSIILAAWVHSNARTRLAALEAMDGNVVAPAPRSLESSAR